MESKSKYKNVHQVMTKRLKEGRYSIGGRLPTEGELSSQFDVSRVTIRKALDMLVRDGYLQSRQGSGYTVLTLSPASDTCLTSFTDAMLRAGYEPTSKFLSLTHLCGADSENASLPIEIRGNKITRISRLRLVDDVPKMLVMTYAPTHLLKGASSEDFPEKGPGQSILRILGDRFQLDWSSACEDISPVLADEEMGEIFDVEVGQPLLKQACSAFDESGEMVFYEDVIRMGAVSFNLSPTARTPRYVKANSS